MANQVDAAGEEFIIGLEGDHLDAYPDAEGIWTDGVGHTGGVRPYQKITAAQDRTQFRADLSIVAAAIEKSVKVPLNQNQFNALSAFVFNIGCSAFEASTLLKAINAKTEPGVTFQWMRWDKIKKNGKFEVCEGLLNRRAKEVALWRKPE